MKNILLFFFAFSLSVTNAFAQRTEVQDLVIKKSLTESGVATPATLDADQDNYALSDGFRVYKLSASTPITITGIIAKSGKRIMLINTSANSITLPNESSESSAANRFTIAGQGQIIMGQNSVVELWYDDGTSRWMVLNANVSVIETVPEPSPITGVVFSNVTNNSVTVSWNPCQDCDFALATIRNPDGGFIPPIDNVSYPGADPNYGDGEELGTDNYLVFNGTETTVNITGLNPFTPYSVVVIPYNVVGGSINYNTTNFGGAAFTTNASATTPTVPYTITSVLTKEDSIIVYGNAGNGTNRAVLMAENKEVDDFFVDDQSYSAGAFGLGDQIGDGNYVVANTTDESPIGLGGFVRDRFYSNPYIAEYTSDKYLLPPANGPPEFPSLLRTAWFYDEEFESDVESDGQTFLEANALAFYDFTKLTGTDGTGISNGNDGLVDQSGNGHTATIVNSPTVEDLTIGAFDDTKTLGVTGTNVITTGHDGSTWFNTSFRVSMSFWIADGQSGANQYLYGVQQTGGDPSRFYVITAGATNNELNILYRTPTADSRWDSNNTALLADGPGFYTLEIQYDFTADQIQVLLNGSPVTGAFISGSMAALDPSDFDPDVNFTIGSANIAGTIQSNSTAMQISRFAVTGITSSQQAADIREYFDFIPSGAGTGFERWGVHEDTGFTYSVSNDSLIVSGTPHGFEDYLYTLDILPDTLGEFRAEMVITVNGDLTTGDTGIGLGLFNDVDTEANHGVVGVFVTDPSNSNYGEAHIYAGSGGTAAPGTFPFRSQSSGTFLPEKDSSYLLTLERDIQGNDAFYSFKITDLYDSSSITTGWLKTGRPEDSFYGSTMRGIIYINGGPFRIKPFSIRRTGFEFGSGETPEEPPPPFDADLVVQKTGSSDANDCSPGAPCATVNRLFQRISQLSPTVVDAFIGAGTYVENTGLVIPTNAGEIRGAGRNITFITGDINLYTSTGASGRSNLNGFLMNANRGSSTNVNTTFRSMTFDGRKNVAGTSSGIKGGFAVRNTHGIILDDVEIRYFNTCAIRMIDVDEFTLNNSIIRESSGFEGTSFAYYNIETSNIGGSSIEGDTTTYNVQFKNSLITAPTFGNGAGWGIVGGPQINTKYVNNTLWENVTFDVNPEGPDNEGHNFNIEGLYHRLGNVLIKDCIFNSNVSWGGLADKAHTDGWTRITGCTWNLPGTLTFAMEMQISKIEVDHNFLRGVRNGVFVSLNEQDGFGATVHEPLTNGDHGDWNIHHNIMQLTTAASSAYGIFGGHSWDMKGMRFHQNTIHFTTSSGGMWLGMFVDQDPSSSVTGLVIQNNAYYGQPSATSKMWYTGNISGGIMRYNKSTHFNVTQTKSGVTSSNNQIHGAGNSLGLGLGTIPTTWEQAFNGDYYRPQTGSVLINAGFGGVTIGALEED